MTPPAPQLPPGAVCAVVVTRHRAELLRGALDVLAKQGRAVDHLVVVDNGPDESAAGVVAASGLPAEGHVH